MHCSLSIQVDGLTLVFGLNADAMSDIGAFGTVVSQCSRADDTEDIDYADSAHIKSSMISAIRVSTPLDSCQLDPSIVLEANTSAELGLTVISHKNMYRQQPAGFLKT